MDTAALAPTDLVDILILVRNPRSIYTTAVQIAEGAGLKINLGPDGLPTLDSISFNEGMLTWMGISGQSSYVHFFLAIIAIIIGLIVAGSALVIYNAFTISIGERKKQFGMFASVGATSGQIRRAVLLEAAVIGAIGIPLGIVGATWG